MKPFVKPQSETGEDVEKLQRGLYAHHKFVKHLDILSDAVTHAARLRAEAHGEPREWEHIYYKGIPQILFNLIHTFPDQMGMVLAEAVIESIESKTEFRKTT